MSNIEKSAKSEKLKSTLSELESALTSWNNTHTQQTASDATGLGALSSRKSVTNQLPDDMRRRTCELLDRLKAQIDEL